MRYFNKNLLNFFVASSIFTPALAQAVTPVFTITPSITNSVLRSDGKSVVSYTITNNASKPVDNISIDPSYSTSANPSGLSIQNNTCTSTLAAGASCNFQVLMQNQSSNFSLQPKVCGFGGLICSATLQSNIYHATVANISSSYPVQAYITASNDGNLFAYLNSDIFHGSELFGEFNFAAEQIIGAAVTKNGQKLYVAEAGNSKLAVINTQPSLAINTRLTVGLNPSGVAVSPDGSKVYVSNYGDNSISVINATTNAVTTIANIGNGPLGLTVSPDGKKLYVALEIDNKIAILNTSNNTFSSVDVGVTPRGITVTPDGRYVYVTNSDSNNVSKINTATGAVSATINTATAPFGIAASPDGTKVYVGTISLDGTTSNIEVINTVTDQVNTVKTGLLAFIKGLALTPDGNSLYATFGGQSPEVAKIDTTTYDVTQIGITDSQLTFGDFVG